MKAIIATDLHFSSKSSIVTGMNPKHNLTLRETNCINSLNWVESLAEQYQCDKIIYAGDMFDKTDLTARELTALQNVVWANIEHVFLVGNHEGLTKELDISSAHLFKMIPNSRVISKPDIDVGYGYQLLYLPYITEENREPLNNYFKFLMSGYLTTQEVKRRYVISHNDIKMNYGMFECSNGFTIEDIESSCDLFLNGHIHNHSKFCKNGYNIGNLTGQNFGEDAFKHKHQACILDTDDGSLQWVVNPFAFNFYKFEVKSLEELNNILCLKIGSDAVMTVKVPESFAVEAKKLLEFKDNIIASRVISIPDEKKENTDVEEIQLETMNHLDAFIHYIKENVGVSETVLSELSEVCANEA